MSLPSFSQKGTSDSLILLPKSIVVKITKDLERYDLCKKEVLTKDSIITDLRLVQSFKDSVIYKLDSNQTVHLTQISNWEKADSMRNIQVTGLKNDVEKYKTQRNWTGGFGLALTVLAILFL
jgi:hypothetical protein